MQNQEVLNKRVQKKAKFSLVRCRLSCHENVSRSGCASTDSNQILQIAHHTVGNGNFEYGVRLLVVDKSQGMRVLAATSFLLLAKMKPQCFVSGMVLVNPNGKSADSVELLSRRSYISILASVGVGQGFITESDAANGSDVVVPGVVGGARFRPTVIDEASSPGTTGPVERLPVVTQLGISRIGSSELTPLSPSLIPFAADNELYYDPFMFGAWETKATLKRKVYPYGTQYLPSKSLLEGSPRNRGEQPGNSASYEARFFSTIADNSANRVTVNLGLGVPKTKIISDRAYNVVSMSAAYDQLIPIQEVEWDPRKDPTRLTFSYGAGPVAEDMRPLGQRRGEVYITARRSESGIASDTGAPVFCASERYRSVMLGPGSVVVSDTETITEYKLVDIENGNQIKALCRIAVYLTPNPNSREGILWQEVGGKSVAFFDYEIDMKRKLQEIQPGILKPCVLTPKDIVQCG